MEAQSVVVIGASRDQEKPGAQLLKVLKEVGFAGRVAGVNPLGGNVFGAPLYPNVRDVPFEIDLAVLLIPPRFVPDALRDCAVKGVKGAVISAEGFAETGTEGATYQEDVRSILKSSGMRGFGPNTLGLVNTKTKLTTSYFATPRMLAPGNIGFAAQSGIFVGALLRYLSSLDGLHLSKGIGLGNKVDVNESDALSFLADDEQTKIIGLYLEDVKDGSLFVKNLKKATAKKPVLIIKSGRTQAGAKASASHTASMAVEDAVFDGIVRQAGAIRLHARIARSYAVNDEDGAGGMRMRLPPATTPVASAGSYLYSSSREAPRKPWWRPWRWSSRKPPRSRRRRRWWQWRAPGR